MARNQCSNFQNSNSLHSCNSFTDVYNPAMATIQSLKSHTFPQFTRNHWYQSLLITEGFPLFFFTLWIVSRNVTLQYSNGWHELLKVKIILIIMASIAQMSNCSANWKINKCFPFWEETLCAAKKPQQLQCKYKSMIHKPINTLSWLLWQYSKSY